MEEHDVVVGEDNNAVIVLLTPERIAEEAEKESKHISEKPMNDWLRNMAGTDDGMPRYLEDLITEKFAGDAGTSLQERYDAKIKIRGEQP
jgi:hypothetical protein